MLSAVSRSLAERTGRSLEEWVALVRAEGPDPLDQNAVRRWLKDVHGVPQNSQWAIADAAAQAAGWVRPSAAEYVDGQYTGAKAGLRPVYDALEAALVDLGPDVRVEGRSTYVPFVRGRQFAAVAAATRTRVDLGLRFTDPPPSSRLEPAKGFAQATHVVRLTKPGQVDGELLGLIRAAYDQNP
jgi:hypothetical protein